MNEYIITDISGFVNKIEADSMKEATEKAIEIGFKIVDIEERKHDGKAA